MRVLVASLVALAFATTALALFVPSFTYSQMFAQSDLVVIALPVRSHDTGNRRVDDHVKPRVPVAEVITDCEALLVLKGPKIKQFKLHHYRDLTDPNKIVVGVPTGISFEIAKHKRFLMFLRREAGGRFGPFAGQSDVENISVQELVGTSAE